MMEAFIAQLSPAAFFLMAEKAAEEPCPFANACYGKSILTEAQSDPEMAKVFRDHWIRDTFIRPTPLPNDGN